MTVWMCKARSHIGYCSQCVKNVPFGSQACLVSLGLLGDMLTDTRSPRKRRFDMGECAKKPPSQPTPKIPKASEIKINTSGAACYSVKPPKILLEQLGNPAIVVGFDIESHS